MNASRIGLAVTVLFATTALAQSPVGRWTTIDDETKKPKSIVSITEENGKVYGKIEKLFRAPGEEQNPVCDKCDGALKNKPIIGMTILKDLKKDGNEWKDGTVMDPANGKTYSAIIEVQDGGKKLKLHGYIGIPLLGRTQYWIRAEDPKPEAPKAEAPKAAEPAKEAAAQ